MVKAKDTDELSVQGRYDADSIRRFRESGWWQDGSAAALLDHWAESQPAKRFVSDGTVELNYSEARERAYHLGSRLLELGVRPDDRVAVQLPNWAEFAVAYLAIARIGGVMVPIMMVYRHAEVRHVLQNSGAVAAITTGSFRGFDHAEMFRSLRSECPAVDNLLIVRAEALDGEVAFDEASRSDGSMPEAATLGPYPDPDRPHVIVYTSGTESTAKGCVHTWNTIDFSGRGLANDVFQMTSEDVVFMPSPVAHSTGLVIGILVPLAVGAETHMMDIWEPSEGLHRIERYHCTVSATATPFVRMALDAAKTTQFDLSSMRFWLCAGAPIPQVLAREFSDTFTAGVLVPLYGCSEVMAATCCHLGDSVERRSSSDGKAALQGIQVKLMDDGREIPTGLEGEICYWGPGAMLGYWREPERTAAVIDSEGWHHTGDLGRLDGDGYLRVTGRLKDIIIRGGANISASEVEGHLLTHPDIREASVVGYPDETFGERACAVVVVAEGATLTLDEITDFLRTQCRISPQKLPERLVLVDALPMTATGKVKKFELRELARGVGS